MIKKICPKCKEEFEQLKIEKIDRQNKWYQFSLHKSSCPNCHSELELESKCQWWLLLILPLLGQWFYDALVGNQVNDILYIILLVPGLIGGYVFLNNLKYVEKNKT